MFHVSVITMPFFFDSEIEYIEDSDKIKFEQSLRSIDCTSHFDGNDMERCIRKLNLLQITHPL